MIEVATATPTSPWLLPTPHGIQPLTFRGVRLDDLPRIRSAFAEGHKHAPGCARMPWRYYKRFVVPELDAALAHSYTQLLGAYAVSDAGELELELYGWIAFVRGRRVDTVHWVSVPFFVPVPHTACTDCDDPKRHTAPCPLAIENRAQLRRRGIMAALFAAAALQERIAYTFRGAKHEHRSDGLTMDERLLPWLRGRGHHVAFVPWEEWSR